MAEQSYRLSIEIDTSNTKERLDKLKQSLESVKKVGVEVSESFKRLGIDNALKALSLALQQVNKNANMSSNEFLELQQQLANTKKQAEKLTNQLNGANQRIAKLKDEAKKSKESIRDLNKALDDHKNKVKEVDSAQNSLSGALGKLKGLAGGAIGALASVGIGASISSIMQLADTMQNYNSQIKMVAESEEQAAAIKQRLRDLADSQAKDIGAINSLYVDSAKSLGQYGKTQEEVLKFTEAVSLAMSVGGKSAQDQASAITQLGQAMQSGVLQGDEFRSIAENSPILLDLIAQNLNKSRAEVKELASDGEITAQVIYESLAGATDELKKKFSEMPMTMDQGITAIKNKWAYLVDDMLNKTNGVSSQIGGALVFISKHFENFAVIAGGVAVVALAKFALGAGLVTKAMTVLKAALMTNPITAIATVVLALMVHFNGLDATIHDIADTFRVVGLVIKDVMGWLGNLWNSAKNMFNNWLDSSEKTAEGSSEAFGGFFSGLTFNLQGLVRLVARIFDTAGRIVKTHFKSALQMATFFATNTGQAFKSVGISIQNFFIFVLNNVINPIINTGIDMLNGLINGINSIEIPGVGSANIGQISKFQATPYKAGGIVEMGVKNYTDNFGKETGLGLEKYIGDKYRQDQEKEKHTDNLGNVKGGKTAQQATQDAAKASKDAAKGSKKASDNAKKAAEKSKEAVEKLKGGLLVGVSGNTGIGTGAHLDIRYSRDYDPQQRRLTKEHLDRFIVNGGVLSNQRITSEHGKRKSPTKGASSYHKGIDFALKDGTDIYTHHAVKDIKTWFDKAGGGYVSSVTFADGVKINLLHQNQKVMDKVKSGTPTGESYKSKEPTLLDSSKEYAKTLEDQAKARLDITKEYMDKRKKLEYELAEQLKQIREAGFSNDDQQKYIDLAKKQYEANLVYQQLQEQQELNSWKWSAKEKLDNEMALAKAKIDIEKDLSEEQKNIAKQAIDDKYQYDLNEFIKLQKEKSMEIAKQINQLGGGLDSQVLDMQAKKSMSPHQYERWDLQNKYEQDYGNLFFGYQDVVGNINKQYDNGEISSEEERNRLLLEAHERFLKSKENLDLSYSEQSRVLRDNQLQASLTTYGTMFGDLANLAKNSMGEQSKAYRTMFAMSKAFASAQIGIQMAQAISQAWSDPSSVTVWQKMANVARVTVEKGHLMQLLSGITAKGFSSGGYTGNGGKNQIAGVVHGQEYVLNAQATKRIGVNNLNALNNGGGIGGNNVIIHNYTGEKTDVQQMPNGDTMVIIGKMIDAKVDAKVNQRFIKAHRQGGELYGR